MLHKHPQIMYNPKRKFIFVLLSSIGTMLAKIQGENKQKQEDKTSQDKRNQKNDQT